MTNNIIPFRPGTSKSRTLYIKDDTATVLTIAHPIPEMMKQFKESHDDLVKIAKLAPASKLKLAADVYRDMRDNLISTSIEMFKLQQIAKNAETYECC